MELLQEFHSSVFGGHSGILRTFKRISQLFYWPGMKKDVDAYVRSCDTCQRSKSECRSPAGLLAPLPIPKQVWVDISMDFIMGLPRSKGKDVIMVVVDRSSKCAQFIALSHPYSAKDVAELFVRYIVRLPGIPHSIVFISAFWREFFKLQGTKLNMSSAYHPQTDGRTKVVNRCLEHYLWCFTHGKPKEWERYLAWAEYWYNTSYHRSIAMTPFEVVYARPAVPIPFHEAGSTVVHEVDMQLRDRDALLRELRFTLEGAQNRMKQYADDKRRPEEFHVDD